ncbi:MAG: hypothetical protein PHV05_03545 [Candidatus Riflebacteria bacterium]|nr:hypothetical protein [Candidatus Riflebacteria bacterium]
MYNSYWNADQDVLNVLSSDERRYAKISLGEDRAAKDNYVREWRACDRVTVNKLPRDRRSKKEKL